MELVKIYQCLCDLTRLRILNLLLQGPLCVCHLQAILGENQVKISKHLAYLKDRKLVVAERRGHWMIHAITKRTSPALQKNLACLQDCARENPIFGADLTRRAEVMAGLDSDHPLCAVPPARRRPARPAKAAS